MDVGIGSAMAPDIDRIVAVLPSTLLVTAAEPLLSDLSPTTYKSIDHIESELEAALSLPLTYGGADTTPLAEEDDDLADDDHNTAKELLTVENNYYYSNYNFQTEILINNAILGSGFRENVIRCLHPINCCGQDIQRLSVVTNLPHLLRDNRDECLRRVIPKIKEFLPIAQPDMQLAASAIFLQIFQDDIVPIATLSLQFLPIILNGLDSSVGEAWLETLLEVTPLLPKDVLRREVMTKAMEKGQLSQNIQSRLMSCKILGQISICLESFVIKKEILPLVQSLCQDVEYEVRACMCRQLDLVAKGLGLESTKSAILPELVELANDEESSVRLAGLDTVVSVLCLLDDDTCTNIIIPLVVKFCKGALQDEDSTLPVVSKHFGKLCHGLSPNMNASQRAWFLDYYRKLCSMGRVESGPASTTKVDNHDTTSINSQSMTMGVYEDDRPIDCRVNAAFNFPAMALFVGSHGRFETELRTSFSRLCKDPSIPVRKTIAHGFHEVARSIGSHVLLLFNDLIILFKDDYRPVLSALVQHLSDTVETFSHVINPDKFTNAHDLLTALISCELIVFSSNDWRLQEQLVDQMSSLTKLFSSEQIYHKLIPRIFDKLHNAKALPVRLAAVKTILSYLRCNRKQEQRKEICARIISEFGEGKSFRSRTLFIDICHQVLRHFSHSFFKEHFYESILELSSDLIPNIRLRLCHILPGLKRTVKLPMDRNLLQQLESHVRKLLINERDRDVLAQLKITVDILDRINCMHDTMHQRMQVMDEDLEDQHKEEAERLLVEMEERERKEEEAEVSASGGGGPKKKGGEKKSGNLSTTPAAKSATSKSALDRKPPANSSTSKASKIPTTPGLREPRRHSQHGMKPVSTSATATVNGSLSGASGHGLPSSGPVKSSGVSSGRGVKPSSSNRNMGSPGSTSSGMSINSAGSNRGGGRSSGGVGSPGGSATRRRVDAAQENQKRNDSIPAMAGSTRRSSHDTVTKKLSH